jgi:YHS domain-containing protein
MMNKLALSLSLLAIGAVAFAGAFQDDLPTVAAADAKALEKLSQMGAVAGPLAANTNLVSVNFSMAGAKAGDAQLESLKPVAEQLFWLNLGGTAVTDGGLKQISGLKNLRRLHLEKTAVGDDGLAALKDLVELRYLNLYATKVTDKGLAALANMKKLENLYLWQTPVTDAGAGELQKALPKVKINRGIEPAAVKPPEPPPGPKAINTKCPVKGEPANAEITFVYKGQAIALCCKDCLGKFSAKPEDFIAKVAEFKAPAEEKKAEPKKEEKKAEKKPDAAAAGKPINAKCPRLGKDVDPAQTVTYKGQVIGLCCAECKGKFEANPTKYIAKVAEFKDPDKK